MRDAGKASATTRRTPGRASSGRESQDEPRSRTLGTSFDQVEHTSERLTPTAPTGSGCVREPIGSGGCRRRGRATLCIACRAAGAPLIPATPAQRDPIDPADPTHTDPTHTDPTHTDPTHTDPTHTDARASAPQQLLPGAGGCSCSSRASPSSRTCSTILEVVGGQPRADRPAAGDLIGSFLRLDLVSATTRRGHAFSIGTGNTWVLTIVAVVVLVVVIRVSRRLRVDRVGMGARTPPRVGRWGTSPTASSVDRDSAGVTSSTSSTTTAGSSGSSPTSRSSAPPSSSGCWRSRGAAWTGHVSRGRPAATRPSTMAPDDGA